MSAASERDRLDPNHPLYYAPRRSSERPELRPIPSQETTAERADRPGSSAISVDAELENAVSEALRQPLDPEIIHEHPALALRRMEMLGAVRRFALPVGIAAVAAVFIV